MAGSLAAVLAVTIIKQAMYIQVNGDVHSIYCGPGVIPCYCSNTEGLNTKVYCPEDGPCCSDAKTPNETTKGSTFGKTCCHPKRECQNERRCVSCATGQYCNYHRRCGSDPRCLCEGNCEEVGFKPCGGRGGHWPLKEHHRCKMLCPLRHWCYEGMCGCSLE